QRRMTHDRVDASGAQLVRGHRVKDACNAACLCQPNCSDASMGVLAAYERNVELAREVQVLEKTGLAAQQARILQPPHGSADANAWHSAGECRGSADNLIQVSAASLGVSVE